MKLQSQLTSIHHSSENLHQFTIPSSPLATSPSTEKRMVFPPWGDGKSADRPIARYRQSPPVTEASNGISPRIIVHQILSRRDSWDMALERKQNIPSGNLTVCY